MTTQPIRRTPPIWLYILPALAAVLVLIIAALMLRDQPPPPPVAATQAEPWLAAQTSDEGPVTVQATPELRDSGIAFAITLDTHSVDLDGIDLTQLAVLRIDGGEPIAPQAWDAPAGGHHRQGTLAFAVESSAAANAGSLELLIREVGGVAERSFVWTR